MAERYKRLQKSLFSILSQDGYTFASSTVHTRTTLVREDGDGAGERSKKEKEIIFIALAQIMATLSHNSRDGQRDSNVQVGLSM